VQPASIRAGSLKRVRSSSHIIIGCKLEIALFYIAKYMTEAANYHTPVIEANSIMLAETINWGGKISLLIRLKSHAAAQPAQRAD
jgi:hypothetical protein